MANRIRYLRETGRDALPRMKHRAKQRFRRALLSQYAERSYCSVNESQNIISHQEMDYVFYPLQYYIESRVTMRAPAFYEQSWLVEYLSRSVPTNHKLVTKDHPQQLGAQPRRAVDTIARYSIPLAPSYHTHEVIENASAVVTLNNTVGYEALLYGKPVITLGKAFYDDYTYKVDDINDIDRTIKYAVNSGGPSEEKIIEFVHGLISGSRAGVWRDDSPESIHNLVEGIVETAEAQWESS
ncbi:hypothetical protein ACFQL4_00505 [Halosimplex aquaticum]